MANDVSILATIMGILLVMGIMMPWVYELVSPPEGTTDYGDPNLDTTEDTFDTGATAPGFNDLWSMFGGIITAFFWTFTWFPPWLITLHILLRIIAIFIIVRLIRGTG